MFYKNTKALHHCVYIYNDVIPNILSCDQWFIMFSSVIMVVDSGVSSNVVQGAVLSNTLWDGFNWAPVQGSATCKS